MKDWNMKYPTKSVRYIPVLTYYMYSEDTLKNINIGFSYNSYNTAVTIAEMQKDIEKESFDSISIKILIDE